MKPRLPPPGDPIYAKTARKIAWRVPSRRLARPVLMEGAVWYSVVLGGRSGRSAAGFLIGGPVPCLGVFPPIAAAETAQPPYAEPSTPKEYHNNMYSDEPVLPARI